MELDEILYSRVLRFLKNRKRAALEEQGHLAHLDKIKPRLLVLARALTGKPIEIFPAEQEGGFKNQSFFLPHQMGIFPSFSENLSFYFFRVAYLSFQHQLGLNWGSTQEQPLQNSRQMAFSASSAILEQMEQDMPLAFELHNALRSKLESLQKGKGNAELHWLYGKWMPEDTVSQGQALHPTSEKIREAISAEIKTMLKAKAVEEIKTIEVDKKAQEDYVLNHNFEKVETLDEFSGTWRDFDGEDDLEDHSEALEELSMKYTVRVDDTAHSVYQTDFLENTIVSESAASPDTTSCISYDEWDYKKRTYKPSFCKLFPSKLKSENTAYYTQTISNNTSLLNNLRKMLTHLDNKMQQRRRQVQGDEFDIDSVTDLYVDIHTGHTPSEKIYLSNRKKEKDISILLLLDVSLSSDGYASGNRILDVEKQVSILFGEILHEFQIDFSIQCFFSKTRNFASFLTVKDFDDPWNRSKFNIGDIHPAGFTRIGVALRHAGRLLSLRESSNKWLILLSDGKPNDFDRYEGQYGIQDVKQALRELNQQQINSYALAIEANARYYLPQMFGENHFQILTNPSELLRSMVKLYEKIKHQS